MDILSTQDALSTLDCDLLVLFTVPGEAPRQAELGEALGLDLAALGAEEGFTGKASQQLVLRGLNGIAARRVLLVGLGEPDKIDGNAARLAGAAAARKAQALRASRVALVADLQRGPVTEAQLVAYLYEGFQYGGYSFDTYKETAEDAFPGVAALTLYTDEDHLAQLRATVEPVAHAIKLARDLVNEPPSTKKPLWLAAQAEAIAEARGLECTIIKGEALHEGDFNLLWAVGKGSIDKPCLIHLVYRPDGEVKHRVAYVGKGVTFDTGGYNLKPFPHILNMHSDMGGGAAVLGAADALGQLRPEGVEIHFIVPAADNNISEQAFRPQDIIRGKGGKTVEIHNTDAEGRLILADALAYAQEFEPDTIVDLATLTGACLVALGEDTAGLFTNDDDLLGQLEAAIEESGEAFWRLPLDAKQDAKLNTPFADMKNIGGRMGGSITAALFLKRWVNIDRWAHLDIAGPAFAEGDGAYAKKGGTGFAVSTLVSLTQQLIAE